MSKLEALKARAQASANASGKPLVLVNLNQFSPLWVIREFNAGSAYFNPDNMVRIDPQSATA